jgi:uncharacterized protein YbbC (DUF1343 family)
MLTGIDLLSTGQTATLRRRIRSNRIGLLSHRAATDRHGRMTYEVLEDLGASISTLFTPEHGFDGLAQAEEPVELTATSNNIHAPIVSLYGTTKESLCPTEEQLANIDLLVIDLVDIGSRYYTYVWSALLAARAAAKKGVHVVILDRPNPLSGHPDSIEGAPQHPDFLSFVGLESLPVRHAMTLGEIVAFFIEKDGYSLGNEGALSLVGTTGWERYRTASSWARPFVAPSPNMPTLETALVYPGACLLEGTNLSEGRGTTLPFQTVGAPHLDGNKLAVALAEYGVPGALVRPHVFRPMFGKHQGQICHGVMIHVTDSALFRPVATYVALVALARAQEPEKFEFIVRPYEFETEKCAFDLLTGNSVVREAMLEGRSTNEVVSLMAPVPPEQRPNLLEAEARALRASTT